MAANLTEDSIVEHKFVVSLNEIKLDIDKPVECIIKYEYNLFCSYEVCTQPFSLHQEDSNFQAIPQDCRPEQNFFISTPKIKEHLKSYPLKIRVYDKDILLGNSTMELCKVYSSEADKMWFGLRYMGDAAIIGSNDYEIGRIKFLFVLETQDCIECKYCNEYFKESAIRKHAIHNKKCNIYYTEEDLKSLEDMANERRRHRRSQSIKIPMILIRDLRYTKIPKSKNMILLKGEKNTKKKRQKRKKKQGRKILLEKINMIKKSGQRKGIRHNLIRLNANSRHTVRELRRF